jgi:hypothetical protein
MATDNEMYRYYEILAHINGGNYIEVLPIVDYFNGVGRTEPVCNYESYRIWDYNSKASFAKKVKEELPELEKKFKSIRDNYYSEKEVMKRKKQAEELVINAKKEELLDFMRRFNREEELRKLSWETGYCPGLNSYNCPFGFSKSGWTYEKEYRYQRYYDERKFTERANLKTKYKISREKHSKETSEKKQKSTREKINIFLKTLSKEELNEAKDLVCKEMLAYNKPKK